MKKIYSILAAVGFSCGLSAQGYYLLPVNDPGYNPGKINTDPEDVNQFSSLGWATVMGSTSTDQWSSNQSVPFSFDFDGSTATSYKVSNTGVLTFTTSAMNVPSSSNQSLPSATLPDKSIVVWGLNLSGSNDVIVSKTFGQAPNRQHWIQYGSASQTGFTNGYSYWSIVLEETTNRIYIVDQRTGGNRNANVAITAGVQINGTTATEVTGSPNLASKSNGSAFPSDNYYYEFGPGFLPGNDIKGESGAMPKFVEVGRPTNVIGTFLNRGSVPLFSADLNYTINGGTAVTGNLSSFSVGSGFFTQLAHPNAWTPSVSGHYTIKFWIDNINNGGVDANPHDDTITMHVQAGTVVGRKLLVEQFASATSNDVKEWNDNLFNTALSNYNTSNKMVVKYQIGNGDPSHNAHADARSDYYGYSNTPTTLSNGSRITFSGGSTPNWAQRAQQFTLAETQGLSEAAFVEIKNAVASYNGQGSTASVTVTANIESNVDLSAGNYRAQVILMNRAYTYSAAPNGETQYEHVMRQMLPDANGTSLNMQASGTHALNVSENNISITSSVSEMSYDLWNHNVEVVILVEDVDERKILNAELAAINLVGIDEAEFLKADIFPNPVNDRLFISLEETKDIKLSLTNSLGQLVMAQEYLKSEKIELKTSHLPAGVYILNLSSKTERSSLRITVTH